MATGKYQKWLEPDGLLLLEAWARDGLTDEQIAGKCDVAVSTLYEWKKRYSEISEALKKGKEIVDVEVENALLQRTKGYTIPLRKTFKCKVIDYDPDTGRKVREREELRTGEDDMHVPADVTAQIFWLKNRKPEAWRDKSELSHEIEGLESFFSADDG